MKFQIFRWDNAVQPCDPGARHNGVSNLQMGQCSPTLRSKQEQEQVRLDDLIDGSKLCRMWKDIQMSDGTMKFQIFRWDNAVQSWDPISPLPSEKDSGVRSHMSVAFSDVVAVYLSSFTFEMVYVVPFPLRVEATAMSCFLKVGQTRMTRKSWSSTMGTNFWIAMFRFWRRTVPWCDHYSDFFWDIWSWSGSGRSGHQVTWPSQIL